MTQRNRAASVRAKLLNRARETQQEFSLVLTRFAIERLLYRLSISAHADEFLLKGALLFEALVSLGITNSRMKDYFDLWILSCHTDFDGDTLRRAIKATFDRRKTTLTAGIPFGLSDSFAQDAQKQMQWQAFLRKNKLKALSLGDIVATLRDFLVPVLLTANSNAQYLQNWRAGGPWSQVL